MDNSEKEIELELQNAKRLIKYYKARHRYYKKQMNSWENVAYKLEIELEKKYELKR